jgi:hypothetical protein
VVLADARSQLSPPSSVDSTLSLPQNPSDDITVPVAKRATHKAPFSIETRNFCDHLARVSYAGKEMFDWR